MYRKNDEELIIFKWLINMNWSFYIDKLCYRIYINDNDNDNRYRLKLHN